MTISSIHTYLTTYIIRIEWWKTEMQERPYDHIQSAKVLVGAAVITTFFWGKLAGVNFILVAFLTYPLSYKHIQYFSYLDYETAQAAACIAIPILCQQIPMMSYSSMPLHCALAFSIWNRGQKLYESHCQSAQEIDRLRQTNQKLSEEISHLQTNTEQLEEALKNLLSQINQRQSLQKDKQEILQQEEDISVQIAQRY